MTEVKHYEVGAFRFEFMPDGGPFKGTLYVAYPEREPYLSRINLSDARSCEKYVERAAEQCGVNEEELKEALNPLSARRHEEVAAAVEAERESGGEGEESHASEADILVRYADTAELFHTPDEKTYVTFQVGDHKETWPVEGPRFEMFLRQRFFEAYGKAPKAQAPKDAIATINARAMFEGHEERVFLRIAGHEGAVYVDLCNDRWEAVEITAEGRQVVQELPVKFVRNKNLAALPHPVPGGSLDNLRSFMNVRTEEDFKLMVGWLVGAYRPEGPYTILEINGQHGSAKSTMVRVLVSLTDPAKVSLRSLPGSERDLAIAANGNWVLTFDNLSYIQPQMSDAMCRLSTGGGFGTRRLYTDDEETLFDDVRPQILNGINQITQQYGDLQDRSVLVTLQHIPDDERRQERKFWADFEAARPKIFGVLLDAVSGALRNVEGVHLDGLPRMADFAAWVTAAEEALGWESGTFMESYAGNRRRASRALAANDPLAIAVTKLLDAHDGEWSGPSQDLLASLNWHASDEVRRSKLWPKAPNSLSRYMNRLAPTLREVGIEYGEREEGHEKKKIKTLKKMPQDTDHHGEEELQNGGSPNDQSVHEPDDAADAADVLRPSSEAHEVSYDTVEDFDFDQDQDLEGG